MVGNAGLAVRGRRLATVCGLVAAATTLWWGDGNARAAVPLVAQAGQAIVAPGLDQAAKPAAPAQPGEAAAAPAPAPAGGASGQPASHLGLAKYAPSYALIVLFVGLGAFIVCRLPPRPAAVLR